MKNLYQIYLISDSTGETLDRIFLALKAQFPNFEYETNHFSFTRTESQTLSILKQAKKERNSIILYTIVNSKLAKYLTEKAYEREIPCFGVLGDLILNFSKVLNQKASHQPSGQHILNEEYYDRIEAIQFTMNHDDGNQTDDIEKSDIILLGVSRTSKTPTSIYLANRGFKTSNIPLVNKYSIPSKITEKNLTKYLQTKNIPDPDLLIRTGNTHRLSNFLLWQLAYAEIFFEKKLWPEFNEKDYNKIIKKFKNIKRNFGKI